MCEHCKVAYSFFFGVQYHKPDCPVIVEAGGVGDKLEAERMPDRSLLKSRYDKTPHTEEQIYEGQMAYRQILFDQYREVCQEIFNRQIPVAVGCDKLTFISQQLDHIEKEYGIDWSS